MIETNSTRGHIKFTQHCTDHIVGYTETMLVDHIIAAQSRRLEFRFKVLLSVAAGPGDMS